MWRYFYCPVRFVQGLSRFRWSLDRQCDDWWLLCVMFVFVFEFVLFGICTCIPFISILYLYSYCLCWTLWWAADALGDSCVQYSYLCWHFYSFQCTFVFGFLFFKFTSVFVLLLFYMDHVMGRDARSDFGVQLPTHFVRVDNCSFSFCDSLKTYKHNNTGKPL